MNETKPNRTTDRATASRDSISHAASGDELLEVQVPSRAADLRARPSAPRPSTESSPSGSPRATHRPNDDELAAIALRVREHIVRMATKGGCFLGASLSCADLLVHLYTRVLDISPERLDDPNRDYLLLSKGHDVPALYGTLAELGYLPRERLSQHLEVGEPIYWHPNRKMPGVEFHSGSLGHLLSVGIGIALDMKLRESNHRVFVILGDGELDEGSVWEALLVAQAHKLDNLVAIVDRNRIQANMRTEDLLPLEPLADKFRAFGAECLTVSGHDFAALDTAFAKLPRSPGKVTAILAETVRGKGLPSLEDRVDRWFCNFDSETIETLVRELHGQDRAVITTPGLVVR